MKGIRYICAAAVAMSGVVAYVARGSEQTGEKATPMFGINIPPGFRDWQVISVAHEAGNNNDLRAVLGNDVAIKAYRDQKLPFPDGTIINLFQGLGLGQPVVFSHGWPLSADAFEDQMFFLASRGYRCIAHDRRGHGRSSQPWNGNDLDTYADDLAELVQALDLRTQSTSVTRPAAARWRATSAGTAPGASRKRC
jgi:pimeloyl-ACP methyl ester carboxylesterase